MSRNLVESWDRGMVRPCADDAQSTYEIIASRPPGKAIRFMPCGVVSHHPEDVRNTYCAYCHRFITTQKEKAPSAEAPGAQSGQPQAPSRETGSSDR